MQNKKKKIGLLQTKKSKRFYIAKKVSEVTQSYPTLGSSVHGIFPGKGTGVGCHLQRDLPNPGIEPGSRALQADALPSEPPGKP